MLARLCFGCSDTCMGGRHLFSLSSVFVCFSLAMQCVLLGAAVRLHQCLAAVVAGEVEVMLH